tara:strand:- start:416 stop:805 length:390 start_codon:yes stop_codon:yes gene_type:complete
MKKILIFFTVFSLTSNAGEVNSWECYKYEGAKIVGQDGEYLGELGPSWNRDSIYNSSSEYSSTWSRNSIFNTSSPYGNSYSSTSAFNDSASAPPKIITEDGDEKYLSVGPSWDSDRLSPYDFKYTCDWD